MKVRTKTLKGWANNSDYFFSQNSKNDTFLKNLKEYEKTNLKGFKRLKFNQTLRGKEAKEKVIIKAYYWRGSWNDPAKETYCTYYKN